MLNPLALNNHLPNYASNLGMDWSNNTLRGKSRFDKAKFSLRYRTVMHPVSPHTSLSRTILIIAGLDMVAVFITLP